MRPAVRSRHRRSVGDPVDARQQRPGSSLHAPAQRPRQDGLRPLVAAFRGLPVKGGGRRDRRFCRESGGGAPTPAGRPFGRMADGGRTRATPGSRGSAPSAPLVRRAGRGQTGGGANRQRARLRAPCQQRPSHKQRNETRQNTLQIPGCHPAILRPTRRSATVRGKT